MKPWPYPQKIGMRDSGVRAVLVYIAATIPIAPFGSATSLNDAKQHFKTA